MALVIGGGRDGVGGGQGQGDMAITGGDGSSKYYCYIGNQLIKLAKLECVVVAF